VCDADDVSAIREAIDLLFERAEARARRRALGDFLAMGPDEDGPEEEVVTELRREFEDHLSRKGGR